MVRRAAPTAAPAAAPARLEDMLCALAPEGLLGVELVVLPGAEAPSALPAAGAAAGAAAVPGGLALLPP